METISLSASDSLYDMTPQKKDEANTKLAPKKTSSPTSTLTLTQKTFSQNVDAPSLNRSIDDFLEEANSDNNSNNIIIVEESKWCWWLRRWKFYMILFSLGIANCGDATEVGSMNYILSSRDFQNDILAGGDFSKRGATIASSIFVGMLVGGIVTGAFGDGLIGRRPTLLMGLTLNCICGMLSALSPNATTLCICRFGSGLGVGAVMSSLLTLATELSPPSNRGFYISVVSAFWTVGILYVSITAMTIFTDHTSTTTEEEPMLMESNKGEEIERIHSGAAMSVTSSLFYFSKFYHSNSWRLYAFVCALPSLVGSIMVYIFVPESARFLGLQGQYQKAAVMANRTAQALNHRGPKLTEEEVKRYFLPLNGSRPRQTFQNRATHHSQNAIRNIHTLYRGSIRNKTLALQFVWFTLSFGSGLCSWITTIFEKMNMPNVYYFSFLFALSNIPGNAGATFLMDRVGRKLLLVISMFLASMFLILFAQAASIVMKSTAESNDPFYVMVAACAFHAVFVMGWCCVACLTSEVFPTAVRSTALGMCSAAGRIAGMSVQYVNGALIANGSTHTLLLLASFIILAGSVAPIVFRIPESKGTHLKDHVTSSSFNKNLTTTKKQPVHPFYEKDLEMANTNKRYIRNQIT